MNKINEGVSDTDDFPADSPGRHLSADPDKEKLPSLPEKPVIGRESAAIDDEAAIPGREKTDATREESAQPPQKAADRRENAVHFIKGAAQAREGEHEGAATARGQEVLALDNARATLDDRWNLLREVNAQLVVAIMEARRLADQVETAKAELQHLAYHDVLTGLPNRMLLQDRLSQAIELASRQNRLLAVLFIDLDRFKYINDSLGHTVGDQLLQSVVKRLAGCVRQSDTISRQGGDEFVVLLSDIKHAEDAALTAQKILATLTPPHLIDQLELYVSASIGISTYPEDGQNAEALIKNADSAMYHAKENGRNNYEFFEREMNVRAVQRRGMEISLRRALERQEFLLVYQPKIELHSNRIVGVEALLRWQNPERGLIPPSEFLSIAEDCGLILPIGRWALREACLQAQAWRQAGLPPTTIAVNISALEFGAKDFIENIRYTLADTALEPRYLELELTESVLMRDAEFTDSILHALTDLGVKLVIDDFGTGYSSLSYLRQFPIHTLKIDQSFVNRIVNNPDDATIVSAVINMGKSLKLRVIAEGVETPEQYAFLLGQYCDEGQGFYFSRPVTAENFAHLLQSGIPSPRI